MAQAKKGQVLIETGVALVAAAATTDSGDGQHFTPADSVMSGADGYTPNVMPDGIVTGLDLVTVNTGNDSVAIAAFTANSQGVLRSVNAGTEAITRAVATDTHKVNSITMDNAGALAVVGGLDGVAFSEVRGAAGAPPYIPVGSVELAQVRTSSNVAAEILASEIFQVPNQHAEFANTPVYSVDNIGDGDLATVAAKKNANIKFASALPAIHTGDVSKGVYAEYYTPSLTDVGRSLDFVPIEVSHSVSSTEYYDGTIGASSSSVGQGAFTALLDDGVNDLIVRAKDDTKTVKFFPNKNKAAYILQQGLIGIARTFPVADQIQASVTISSENESANFNS